MRASTTAMSHLAAGIAALILVLACAIPAASAGRASAPDQAIDLVQAAEPIRRSETATLLDAFLTADLRRVARQDIAPREDRSPDQVRVGQTLAFHTLNPDFVRGLSGASPTRADAATTTVTDAHGRTATVRTAMVQDRWQIVAIASGDEEERHARAAGTDRTAFLEPQANAWYAWSQSADRVEPLGAEARNVLGAPSVSVAAYQRLVADRYGGQLPGSVYDTDGFGGGGSPILTNWDAPVLPAVLALLTGLLLTLTIALPRPPGQSAQRAGPS